MNIIERAVRAAVVGLLVTSASANAQVKDSLDLKIGQMILIGFPGPSVDQDVLREVREGKVGTVLLFEKNIPVKNSFVELKKITWTYQQAAPIPLFIAIDQEGGRVNRLKDKYGFPRSITASAMGKANSLDSVRFYAEATASTLAGLGINVNFAPVVDLAANPANPVIVRSGRAFSNNADSVSILAREFVIQHRKYNVLTSLKHFPGHGSSEADTHFGIADVTNTWTERELQPYKTLIDGGYTDAVMTAHIVNRNLDKNGNPGTLSADILTGILRNRLGFNGLVFSDDMQMHAIAKHYGLEEAIRMAILAGVDIMTFSNNIAGSDVRTVDKVHSIVRGYVEQGIISRQRIDESFRRIMAAKRMITSDPSVELVRQVAALRSEVSALEARVKATQEVKQEEQQPSKKRKRRKRG